MNPAFSVIFLTTLIGAGQGLFLSLILGNWIVPNRSLAETNSDQYIVIVCSVSLALLVAGLIASFFHLGHPERAWRAASQWRTSWLSREVIVLPLLMGCVLFYGANIHWDLVDLSIVQPYLDIISVTVVLALFVCTGMIYACIKFIQEWSTPLTLINYTLFGLMSGMLCAVVIAFYTQPELVSLFTNGVFGLTGLAFLTRMASLYRNKHLKRKSTIQSAIGIKHPRITQKSQGFMGGSFNTRDFFHGVSDQIMANIRWIFIILVFILPLIMMKIGLGAGSGTLLIFAVLVQYLGLLAERWFFFAQANHPQNMYYQTVG